MVKIGTVQTNTKSDFKYLTSCVLFKDCIHLNDVFIRIILNIYIHPFRNINVLGQLSPPLFAVDSMSIFEHSKHPL